MRRNNSRQARHYRIIFADGSEKRCTSDASYHRFIRNNDCSEVIAIWYNHIKQNKEYVTWIKSNPR